jgi:hypothetical protein
MGLLDWLGDSLGSGSGQGDIISGGNPMQPAPPPTQPMFDQQGIQIGEEPRRHVPSLPTGAMPPQMSMDMAGDPLKTDLGGGMQGAGPQPYPQGTDPMTAGGPPPYPPGLDPMRAGGDPGSGPGLPFAPGTDPMTAGGTPGPGPGLPPPSLPPGIPVPAPRPQAAIPPNAAPATGVDPQAAIESYRRAGGTMMDPGRGDIGPPQAQTALGRALGLDPNREKSVFGAAAEGLKSVGENYKKPGLAALSGSAGSALEGGNKADDKLADQKDKALQRAIAAQREGNHAEYQKNYLQYQIAATKEKLALAKEKQASGTASVMNSPEQLYLRAVGATNQDGNLKIANNKVTEMRKQFGADSKEAKAATAEYEKLYKEVRDGHLKTLKVDPGQIKALENKPGFSDKTPYKDFPKDPAAAQKAFDALPEGAYFINPKDGRLLTKKGATAQAAVPGQQQSGLTPPLAPMPLDPNQEAA